MKPSAVLHHARRFHRAFVADKLHDAILTGAPVHPIVSDFLGKEQNLMSGISKSSGFIGNICW
jgi:hypothetical protein